MPSPLESRAALKLLTGAAVATGLEILNRVPGTPEAQRAILLETIPTVVGYYSEGSAALAADFYEDTRAAAGVTTIYTATSIVQDRTVKLRSAIAWGSEPLFDGDRAGAASRLAEVIQLETARPYRDTILTNRRQDPASAGWRRITVSGCRFCRMLADRGAVYRQATARFAAHTNCHCAAEPVFEGQAIGPEADVYQYLASKRNRTAEQREQLRNYLEANF